MQMRVVNVKKKLSRKFTSMKPKTDTGPCMDDRGYPDLKTRHFV